MVIGVAQAGRVDNMQRHTVDVDMFTQDVPGGAGDIGDNRCLAPGQNIEQTRFASIRPTGNDDCHTITQQSALPGLTLHCG
ncbi:hypothetical protein D3C78_1208880 [compost metagenome]